MGAGADKMENARIMRSKDNKNGNSDVRLPASEYGKRWYQKGLKRNIKSA